LTRGLKSWIIEESLDRRRWTEINRQTDLNGDFIRRDGNLSFAVPMAVECRLSRLTQTVKNRDDQNVLYLAARSVSFPQPAQAR
jgi:hypothetical protein